MIISLALGLIGLVAYGTSRVYAENNFNRHDSIIQKLVDRFGLDKGEVETVFDEIRGERQTEMQARFTERLDQTVAEGKITPEQKEAILQKKQEMQANRLGLKDLSLEERQIQRETHQKEMKAWAEENGLDLKDLFGGMGMRGEHLGGMKGNFGLNQ